MSGQGGDTRNRCGACYRRQYLAALQRKEVLAFESVGSRFYPMISTLVWCMGHFLRSSQLRCTVDEMWSCCGTSSHALRAVVVSTPAFGVSALNCQRPVGA